MFPLLEDYPSLFVYCCDFSPRAVGLVQANEDYDTARCKAFQNDLTQDDLSTNVPPASVDCVTMLFMLSAISPENFAASVANVAKVLKPGGMVLFRDYGLYDHAMVRFKPGHKLSDAFYVRGDGTRAYYFTVDELNSLFEGVSTSVCRTDK